MHPMRTVALEFLRRGRPHNQLLSPLTDYLALCGNHPAAEVHVPFEHRQFLRLLRSLRYTLDEEAADRQAELERMRDAIGEVLAAVPSLATYAEEEGWLHLRVAITATELAMLPFELAAPPAGFPGPGYPLLINPERPVVMTREVRQPGEVRYAWPEDPKVLVVAAVPPGVPPIPLKAHLRAIHAALEPWIGPVKGSSSGRGDVKERLRVLPKATLGGIRALCSEQAFTHVHVLAHGAPFVVGEDRRFGLALCADDGGREVVDGTALAEALRAGRGERDFSRPAVVTVAACDSGNLGSVLEPGASLAHALHEGGIPFVLASQFPLSIPGSVTMTEAFYGGVLRGTDVRRALFEVRQRLYLEHRDSHDWASMVAYARLPRDYADQLRRTLQRHALAALRTAQAWAGQAVKKPAETERWAARSHANLDTAIEMLRDLLDSDDLRDPSLTAESHGLLGSATRRKAELLHVEVTERRQRGKASRPTGEQRTKERADEFEALHRSRAWYRRGHDGNLVSHWCATQFLSLEAVLEGTLESHRDRWSTAKLAAELQIRDPATAIWAHGSLWELWLLYPLAAPDADRDHAADRAREHVRRFLDLAARESFEVDSTRREVRRYTDAWWGAAPYSKLPDWTTALAKELLAMFPGSTLGG